MTLDGLFASWPGIAPALGNHLWQSTLFAAIAGLLTLTLRKNSARARYRLWLAASVKFLIPFSLLVTIGSHLSLSHGSAGTNAFVYRAMDAVGQPFPQLVIPETSGVTPSAVLPRMIHLVPILLALWLSGFLVIVSLWFARWRRISATVRSASPLQEGREVEALRRLANVGALRKGVQILLSRASLEPGIFGIARPVLLWPEGLSKRLDNAHLEAILAHELWHVRRRDNLAAAIHMLIEAIFWFHPLVWWLGARLVEERERACDEEVLEMGKERQVYAESILKICEFCVESPLACVSGVTGSDLKKRMVYIMTKTIPRKLDFGKKLLLSTAGLVAVVVPIAFGLVRPTKNWAESQALGTPAAPMFESAMIRPNNGASFETWIMWKANRFTVTNFTLQKLIQWAYGVQSDRISGGPAWLNSQGYDIDAKVGESIIDELHELSPNQRFTEQNRMLQALLADRFKLAFHRETKEVSAYALTIAKNGPKLQEAKPGDTYPNGFKDDHGRPVGAGIFPPMGPRKLVGQGVPIADLVGVLSERLGRSVVDETGLKGTYDFTLDCFAPLRTPESEPSLLKAVPEHAEALTKVHALETESVLEAVSEQLGLELNLQTVPLAVLVIDHAEKIAGNEQSPSQSSRRRFTSPVLSGSVTPHQVEATSQPQENANSSKYETVSVKPHTSDNDVFRMMFEQDGFSAVNVTLRNFVRAAYGVEEGRIFGAPNWFNSEKYDVDARVTAAVAKELAGMSQDQLNVERQRMLQALLADRFKLTLHRQTTQLGVYVLVVAKDDPKLHEAKPGDTYANGLIDNGQPLGPDTFKLGRYAGGRGQLVSQGFSMANIVRLLSENILDRGVIDKTGLTGNYDFTLEWKIGDESQGPMFKETGDHPQVTGSTPLPEFSGPSFFNAIQEQLGLKLESGGSPTEILVIDHAEKPSGN